MSAKSVPYPAAVLALREAYDLTYGLVSAVDTVDPMSVHRMHPHEDHITDGAVSELMFRIVSCKLPEITGNSMLELMEIPMCLLEPLLKMAESRSKHESTVANNLMNELNES